MVSEMSEGLIVYLLECNACPDLSGWRTYTDKPKRVIEDIFSIAIDPYFPPYIPAQKDYRNGFHLVFEEEIGQLDSATKAQLDAGD